jgi:hypothetical protein
VPHDRKDAIRQDQRTHPEDIRAAFATTAAADH